jgi:hypothetical protein
MGYIAAEFWVELFRNDAEMPRKLTADYATIAETIRGCGNVSRGQA